jgi:hypothetical protein
VLELQELLQTLEGSPLLQIWANLKKQRTSATLLCIALSSIFVISSGLSARAQAAPSPSAPNYLQQGKMVDDLSKQVDAQQKVLSDLNTKISQQNHAEQAEHVNQTQQNMQAQAAVVASIERQIGESKNQGNDSYLDQADQIQQSRVERDQIIHSAQLQVQQQRQVVANVQNQLQAQIASNIDNDTLDYYEQLNTEQVAKLNQLEDYSRSLQVEAGQAAVGEDFSQHQQQSTAQENTKALQAQYRDEVQKYSQLQSQYQSAIALQAKADDQLSTLADQYEVQREKYLDLQEKYADAQAQLKKMKPVNSLGNSKPKSNPSS